MAYSQSDLAAIEQAIATGALTVRYADGRLTTFRSLADLRSIRDQMRAELGIARPSRVFVAEHKR
jgi:hypothetical protein